MVELSSMVTAAEQRHSVDLSVVLVCWNNKRYLEPCLQSLYSDPMRSSFEVTVTDNGSTDGSLEMLRDQFPLVQIIRNSENVGLGKASNQGMKATDGRYILLLNNDTIVNGASLDAMVEFLDRTPDAGAVGGKLLNPDGSVQSCYFHFPSLWEEFLIATRLGELVRPGYPANTSDGQLRSISWICSACVMLRREALDEVGLLDESFFIYGDEVDLQYRLKQAGWQVYYLPEASTIHFGGRSMDRWPRRKMVNRGKILFFEKHYGPFRSGLLRGMLLVLSLAKMLVWAATWLIPRYRTRARKELASNLDVIRLCIRPE
jgi:GT2 family glycosyltransferase